MMISTKISIFSLAIALSTSALFGMQENNALCVRSLWIHNPLPYEVNVSRKELKDNTVLLTLSLPKCYEPSTVSFTTKAEKETIIIRAPDHTPQYGKLIIRNKIQELATIYALTDPEIFHAQQANK